MKKLGFALLAVLGGMLGTVAVNYVSVSVAQEGIEGGIEGGGGGSSGPVDLADAVDGVMGILGIANGGTNLSAAADDNVMVGNATTWQTKAIGDCDDSGGNHLNYDTTTNAFSCGTSGDGSGSLGETTGTFEATFTNMCTTTPSQTWNYTKIGNIVVLRMVDNFTCTSDSTNFASDNDILPLAITPAAEVNLGFIATVDNTTSTDEGSCVKINASNRRIEYFRRQSSVPCDANTWTNTGTKGVIGDFANWTATYSLVN